MLRDGWELVFQGADDLRFHPSWLDGPSCSGRSLWLLESAEEFLQRLDDIKIPDEDVLFKLAVWSLRVYAQGMWVGPELGPAEKAELPKSFLDPEALKLLSVEGELMESLVDYPGALYIGRALLRKLTSPLESPQAQMKSSAAWWLGRSAVMHHRSLAGGLELCDCPKLKQEVFHQYVSAAKALCLLSEDFTLPDSSPLTLPDKLQAAESNRLQLDVDEKCQLLLELLNVFTFYDSGSFFRTYLEGSAGPGCWPFSVELTGRQGIRRVHQKDAIPQLCVIVRSKLETEDPDDQPFPRQSEVPRDIGLSDLDVTNDILSRPKFVDSDARKKLTVLEKFYLLAWANERLKESILDDQIGLSVISSLTAEILAPAELAGFSQKENLSQGEAQEGLPSGSAETEAVTKMEAEADWCLWWNALYTRSRAEYNRSKTKERSCLQILTLEEQVSRPSPLAGERLKSLWLTGYPNKWELRREVGKKFREMGAPLTARDMFAKMHLWTEVIECLVSIGRKNEAQEIVDSELEKEPLSPTLWWLKGEVETDAYLRLDHYAKSWELSGGRFYKAANAAGHLCVKNSFDCSHDRQEEAAAFTQQALSWFKKTVALKPHLKNTQFTYGSLLMRHGSDAEALSAFNAVLLHNDGDGDYRVWANMGAIHLRGRNWQSALKCFQQAARLAQNQWVVWDSYMKVCFVLRDYLAALEGLQKMLELNQGCQIPLWCFEKLLEATTTTDADADADDGDRPRQSPSSPADDYLTERVKKFFEDYFLRVEMPLPSQSSGGETAFDSEGVTSSLDRFEIWKKLSLALDPPKKRLSIVMKCFRQAARLLEDCLNHESSASPQNEAGGVIELLCDRWSSVGDELFERLAEARGEFSSLDEYEEMRIECCRLVEGSAKRIRVLVDGCCFLGGAERTKCLLRLRTHFLDN